MEPGESSTPTSARRKSSRRLSKELTTKSHPEILLELKELQRLKESSSDGATDHLERSIARLQQQLSLVNQTPKDEIATAGEDLPDVAEENESSLDNVSSNFLESYAAQYASEHVERAIENLSLCSWNGGRKVREQSFKILKERVQKDQEKKLQADIDRLSIKRSFVRNDRKSFRSDNRVTPVHIAIPDNATSPDSPMVARDLASLTSGLVVVKQKRKSKNCIIC